MSDYPASSYGLGGDSGVRQIVNSFTDISNIVAFNEFQGNKKQEVMDQVRSELALANAQELINKINEKCYLKCVPKPGARLESGEQACLSKCMDRYMEAWNVVSRAYVARLQRESQGGGL